MADSSLAAIQKMVRRITKSPSEAVLTTAQLNEYINTFVLSDFPQNLRTFALRTTLTFYTQPNVDTYQTVTLAQDHTGTNPLFDFINRYTAVHEPLYIAGVESVFTQYRDEFFRYYPQTFTVAQTNLFGDGMQGPYVGMLNAIPVLQNNVIFTVPDTNGTSMVLVDQPVNSQTGNLFIANNFNGPQYGTINYITGAFTFTTPNNTEVQAPIWAETIPYQPGIPLMCLFYDNQFKLWPVPDNAYPIQLEADISPMEFLSQNQNPLVNQWWQYIALGACIKVFRDRMEIENIQKIMPEYEQQQALANRTTIELATNKRTETIYSSSYRRDGWFWSFGRWPY